jgi:hypothetical protein
MTVNFKFSPDEKIKVEKLGIDGIVSICAVDSRGNIYYVRTATNSDWWEENLLSKTEA